MNVFDQMQQCCEATKAEFQAAVMGLRYVFCSIDLTGTGRLILVRAGDERGPIIGFREDYLDRSAYFIRPR